MQMTSPPPLPDRQVKPGVHQISDLIILDGRSAIFSFAFPLQILRSVCLKFSIVMLSMPMFEMPT